MVERIIELSVRHKWVVFGAVFALALFAADSMRKTPLDALPDLSDPQVIVYTEWMGRSLTWSRTRSPIPSSARCKARLALRLRGTRCSG